MPSPILQFEQENVAFDAQFIDDITGEPFDITGDTPIDMQFRKPDNTKVTENGITVIDLVQGTVSYNEATTAKTNVIGAWEYRPITNSKRKGRWIQYIVHD